MGKVVFVAYQRAAEVEIDLPPDAARLRVFRLIWTVSSNSFRLPESLGRKRKRPRARDKGDKLDEPFGVHPSIIVREINTSFLTVNPAKFGHILGGQMTHREWVELTAEPHDFGGWFAVAAGGETSGPAALIAGEVSPVVDVLHSWVACSAQPRTRLRSLWRDAKMRVGTIGTGVPLHHRRSNWCSRTSDVNRNTKRRFPARRKLMSRASQQTRYVAR